MFDVLGVIDLRGGLAVRAREGRRAEYAPIETVAGTAIRRGDAESVARAYIERFGIKTLYIADLDAIEGHEPQRALTRSIAALGVPLWVDAGISSVDHARLALDSGASRVIVGLETLPSFDALKSIGDVAGHDRVVFSLDVRNGKPIATSPDLAQQRPEALLTRAIGAGASAVIVLDLARVGAGRGLDLELITRLRATSPSVRLYAGGGVRGLDDLEDMSRAGCDGALVASALIDGRLTTTEMERSFLAPST